jgi:hypothetical protein
MLLLLSEKAEGKHDRGKDQNRRASATENGRTNRDRRQTGVRTKSGAPLTP